MFSHLTIKELKEELKNRGARTTGRKAELLQRLLLTYLLLLLGLGYLLTVMSSTSSITIGIVILMVILVLGIKWIAEALKVNAKY